MALIGDKKSTFRFPGIDSGALPSARVQAEGSRLTLNTFPADFSGLCQKS